MRERPEVFITRETNRVKVYEFGKSAAKDQYGQGSETEWKWVLLTAMLKIQSIPSRTLEGRETPTRKLLCAFLSCLFGSAFEALSYLFL